MWSDPPQPQQQQPLPGDGGEEGRLFAGGSVGRSASSTNAMMATPSNRQPNADDDVVDEDGAAGSKSHDAL